MSNKALNWAWEASISVPGAKFVLVALADHGGDHDGEDWTCRPSIGRLCRFTSQSERAVQRHLKWLTATAGSVANASAAVTGRSASMTTGCIA